MKDITIPWGIHGTVCNLKTSLESILANIEGERRRGHEPFGGSTYAIEHMLRDDIKRAERALEILDAAAKVAEGGAV